MDLLAQLSHHLKLRPQFCPLKDPAPRQSPPRIVLNYAAHPCSVLPGKPFDRLTELKIRKLFEFLVHRWSSWRAATIAIVILALATERKKFTSYFIYTIAA